MAIRGVDHVEVWAKNLTETVAFYTDVLGFEHLRTTCADRGNGQTQEQTCVILGEVMIELIAAPAERVDEPVDFGAMGVKAFALTVEDMQMTVARLKEQGVTFIQEPKPGNSFDGWRAEIIDPNGIGIELREWIGDSVHNAAWEPTNPGINRTK